MFNQVPQPAATRKAHALRLLAPLVLAALSPCAQSQSISSLSQARSLYVEPFTGSSASAQLRLSLIHRLSSAGHFHLVPSPQEADATVKGEGQVWVRGYITTNSRTPLNNRQAVYGGFLSLQVVAANGQPLWSWLTSPGKIPWTSIVDDLAGHAAKKLLEAAEAAPAPPSPPSAPGALAQTSLSGAGATFPAPLYQKWFEDFAGLHPGVSLSYSAIGSAAGVESLIAGKLDFAGSDVAPEVLASTDVASRLRRVASVLGGVVPIYNLQGVSRDLRFTPETLANIYLGKVRRWNDPEILSTNKGIDLPDAQIVVVHRSDGSGTTWVWTDFLSRVSPAWSSSVGRGVTLDWPTGIAAAHNEGVAATVQVTPNSIGYVELTYAIQHQLSFAAVRNRSGQFVRADLDSLAEAATSSTVPGALPAIITNAPGKYAYPIAAFTWLLVPAQQPDPAKKAAFRELLRWVLTSGQKECSALGYAPLPKETAETQLRLLDSTP